MDITPADIGIYKILWHGSDFNNLKFFKYFFNSNVSYSALINNNSNNANLGDFWQ